MNIKQRQEIERRVVRHLIRAMKKHGWDVIAVDDGGDELVPCITEMCVMENVFAVDESKILFRKWINRNRHRTHTALIVLGNDGWDAIADYTFRDDDDFGKVMELEVDPYIDKLEAECLS